MKNLGHWRITIEDGYQKHEELILATNRHSVMTMFAYIRFWLKITSPVRNFMARVRNRYYFWRAGGL